RSVRRHRQRRRHRRRDRQYERTAAASDQQRRQPQSLDRSAVAREAGHARCARGGHPQEWRIAVAPRALRRQLCLGERSTRPRRPGHVDRSAADPRTMAARQDGGLRDHAYRSILDVAGRRQVRTSATKTRKHERIPTRFRAFVVSWLISSASAYACSSHPALLPVSLPDLSRVDPSVQAQARERFDTLTAKSNSSGTPPADLATAYG